MGLRDCTRAILQRSLRSKGPEQSSDFQERQPCLLNKAQCPFKGIFWTNRLARSSLQAAFTLINACVPVGCGVGSSNSCRGALESTTLKLFVLFSCFFFLFCLFVFCADR